MRAEARGRAALVAAELPEPLARHMLGALASGDYDIGSAPFEGEIGRNAVEAAVEYAERWSVAGGEWEPGYGSPRECEDRVRSFVRAIDACAWHLGTNTAVAVLTIALMRRYE